MPASAESVARTRERIHEAAISLFTRQGFHGTGMRQIAGRAEVSLGNLYNHHETKRALFGAIIDEFEKRYTAADTPLSKALASFRSLDDLEALGEASRAMVERFEDYIRLIYVDVVELQGEHIRRLFGGMRARYDETLGQRLRDLQEHGRIGDVDPVSGLMTAMICFFYLFNMERVFGVASLYGTSDRDAIATISQLLREGMSPR
ncbi:TetR/AcrR family transcriptional regulator [Planctomycetota bacterium]